MLWHCYTLAVILGEFVCDLIYEKDHIYSDKDKINLAQLIFYIVLFWRIFIASK